MAQPNAPYTGTLNATVFGPLCFNFDNQTGPEPDWVTPQEVAYLATLDAIPASSAFSEDCTINLLSSYATSTSNVTLSKASTLMSLLQQT